MTTQPTPAVPENRPTPLGDLLEPRTPTGRHYRRNHFPYPRIDPERWRLPVVGAVTRTLEMSLADLVEFPAHARVAVLECAGHRRTDFQPPISGVQWGLGALSQAEWGGVALADVLRRAGITPDAVEVVFHGADRGPFAELPGVHTFSRSIPLAKALHPDTLLATTMNGEPLSVEHGAPVRALVPGWYAMDSVKWITRIEVATEPFRGPFQELDYRFQVAGDTGIGTRIDEMRIHALAVSIADGATCPAGVTEISGIAWGGGGVATVEIRIDTEPWHPAKITDLADPYERSLWTATVELEPGPHRIEVRATDVRGRCQPDELIWNKRGYVNNSVQRIAVIAE